MKYMPFSNWNNFDKILDLLDDFIELKEQIQKKNNIQKYERTKEGKLICI